MTKNIFFVVFFIFCFGEDSKSQKIINDATLNYKVEINSVSNQQLQSDSNSNKYIIYVKGLSSRSDLNTSMGSETAIYDAKKEKGFVAKSYSGQKLLINLNKTEWMEHHAIFRQLKFNVANELKNILGFYCKKATAKLDSGEMITVYFEPNLMLANQDHTLAFPDLHGIPILIERVTGGRTFSYMLTDVNYEIVNSNTFEFNQKNYRLLNYEDARKFKK